MNSSSLVWASYCSSAPLFLPFEESGVSNFRLFFRLLAGFQQNREPTASALKLFQVGKFLGVVELRY